MIPLVKPYFPPREELMPALEEIIYSGYVATGQPVYDFEDKFKAYIGNPNIISVHSGTDALHLAYILAGIKAGDEQGYLISLIKFTCMQFSRYDAD